ncbi:MAG TPA: glycosyltransferase family 1 protein [Usitatibacter sp.]|nr:glycosyltransferase family 1 protein [Usitatibacter sp.]
MLLELRPAFDGHAGIPQETRLLFRALRRIEGVEAEGLIQSSGHVLAKALPVRGAPLSGDRELYRLSRVVISSRQGLYNPYIATIAMALRTLAGGSEELGRFEAKHFRDFLWQGLFARTLHADDFDSVTSAGFRVARVPWTGMHRCGLATRLLGHALYPRLDTSGFDVMIAETPYPARVSPATCLVVRYHDAIPLLMPHTISDMAYHQASHYHALRANVAAGARFACVSEATRKDLVSIFPQAAERSVVIHNMVSHHYFPGEASPGLVPEILRTRTNRRIEASDGKGVATLDAAQQGTPFDYVLMVSTLEPRKNHAALVAAWEELRSAAFPKLKLVVVGMPGWGHEPIVAKLKPWIERGELFALEDVPSADLRLLYRGARATVCPSFGEGFDFSGVEAMRCGSPVVASDIPVHREIFGDAARYFSPYSSADLAQAIASVIDLEVESRARSQALVQAGHQVSSRYLPDTILPQWRTYLQSLRPT